MASHSEEKSIRKELKDNRAIRLLELFPGQGSEQISCSLQTVSLEDAPPYEALSYTWGTLVLKNEILVDGTIFRVTSNLESGLRYLRKPDESRLIWVDLICIDQGNEAEKSLQVALMGEVYRQASRCLVWLGDYLEQDLGETDITQVFEIFDMLTQGLHFHEMPCLESAEMFERYGPGFKAFKSFISNQWWQRIWTVQEIVLPRESLVVWGSRSIPFDTLVNGVNWLAYHRGQCCIDFHAKLPQHLRGTFADFTAAVAGIMLIHNPDDLQASRLRDLLWRFRYRQSSDPKDKVLGLLGMIKQSKKNLHLELDYGMSIEEVYANVAWEILREDNELVSLIGRRGESTALDKLPSWATDWSVAEPKAQYWIHCFRYYWFSCDRGNRKDLLLGDSGPSLRIEGTCFDQVKEFGVPYEPSNDSEVSSQILDIWNKIKGWRDMALGIKWDEEIMDIKLESSDSPPKQEDYVANGTRVAAFWSAMLGGLIMHPDESGSVPQRRYEESDGALLEDAFKKGQTDLPLGHRLSLQQWLVDQTFFVTERGYFGVGPRTLEKGDQVWILSGSNVPFILREQSKSKNNNGERTIVGDCYVDGIMYGESFQDSKLQSTHVTLV